MYDCEISSWDFYFLKQWPAFWNIFIILEIVAQKTSTKAHSAQLVTSSLLLNGQRKWERCTKTLLVMTYQTILKQSNTLQGIIMEQKSWRKKPYLCQIKRWWLFFSYHDWQISKCLDLWCLWERYCCHQYFPWKSISSRFVAIK